MTAQLTTQLPDKDQLQTIADEVGFWFHSIDLGQGVVTKGLKTADHLQEELRRLHFPNLHGKTVLDVGAFDGFYSFAAERLGAAHVTAMDYYTWSLDLPKHIEYWRECKQKGKTPVDYEKTAEWRPDALPGKRGFDAAHRALQSKVEAKVLDFMEADLQSLDKFDVVLFLGVLYHLKHPLLALQRLAQVTREVAIIETEAVEIPGFEQVPMCEFFETNELNGDTSNWWAPNAKALEGMCRTAGFGNIELTLNPRPRDSFMQRSRHKVGNLLKGQLQREVHHYRLIAHASI